MTKNKKNNLCLSNLRVIYYEDWIAFKNTVFFKTIYTYMK